MSRLAILIAAAYADPKKPLPGATKDIEDFANFLRSPLGGAWKKDEVVEYYDDPDDVVAGGIVAAGSVDYSLVVFSGHGNHPKGGTVLDTRIRMTGGLGSVSEICPTSRKSTVIIDACRNVVTVEKVIAEQIMGHVKMAKKFAKKEDFYNSFDASIRKTPAGSNYVFACRVGEKATIDNDSGSIFIQALLAQATEWDANHSGRNSTQRMGTAVNRAQQRIKDNFPQNAEIYVDTQNAGYFPFALHLD